MEVSPSVSGGVHGSTFHSTFHVIVGTISPIIYGISQYLCHSTKKYQVDFELTAWYWKFANEVWSFQFVPIYWWGGSCGMNRRTSGMRNKILEIEKTQFF